MILSFNGFSSLQCFTLTFLPTCCRYVYIYPLTSPISSLSVFILILLYSLSNIPHFPYKVTPIEWPLDENTNGRFYRTDSRQNIADYLVQKKIDLVINLPLRLHRLCSIVTHGYRTRQLAVQNHIPLITDVKCAKLFVKVRYKMLFSDTML